MKKNQKGITLIALVVTIIVLLILAAVSLNLISGSEGIINKAAKAVDETNEASFNEKLELKLVELKAGYYDAKYANRPTGSTPRVDTFSHYLKDILDEGNTDIDGNTISFVKEENGVITIEIAGKEYTIDENGNVTKQGPSPVLGNIKVVKIESGEETEVTESKSVPQGTEMFIKFTASIEGGSITSVKYNGTTLTPENGEYKVAITKNGTYQIALEGSADGQTSSKTESVTVTQYASAADELQVPSTTTEASTVYYNPNGESTWLAEYYASTTGYSDVALATGNKYVSGTNTNMSITEWKVLDVKDGIVRLIPNSPSPNSVTLQGAQGYNNAVQLLDKACSELYGGKITKDGIEYEITAESIDMELIEGLMNDKETSRGSSYMSQQSNTYSRGSSWYPAIYAEEENRVIDEKDAKVKLSGLGLSDAPTDTNGNVKFFKRRENQNGRVVVTEKYQAGTRIQPYQTYYYLDQSNFESALKDGYGNLLAKNTYWVASRCVYTYSSDCAFYVRNVNSGTLSGYRMFRSNGNTISGSHSLFPVVSLSSELISKNDQGQFVVE